MTDGAIEPAVWHRLHPLSPLVKAGRATIGLAIVLAPSVLTGRGFSGSYFELGLVAVLVALGLISWLVTRWRVEDDDLRIETGLLRRQSLRFPLAQVQAIDIVRPGLARLFGVAELRLRMAGDTGATARLAYLHAREAEPLRERLLALAHGAVRTETDTAPAREEEHVLMSVPTGRLAASILLSDVGFVAIVVLVALVVVAVVAPSTAVAVLGGGAAPIVTAATLVWRRFNQEYRLTLAEAADGLRLRSGLVALTSETIRPGRVQAVRMVEPLLWRRLGWCRLEVDLAGRQRRKGEGEAQRRSLRAVLPVGSRELAFELLDRIVPDAPRPDRPAPRRVLLKSPLRFRFLAWGRSERCVVTRTGRIRRVTAWVPLAKAQSFRRVQGPLQRRLRLASLHLDTAGRSVHATLRDRDVAEADEVLAELVDLARA
ncbi:MAG: putative rane protein, partial [Gaiellaceae bacterium]|nr:putative rane protein [Gaiellaceae bacterium]